MKLEKPKCRLLLAGGAPASSRRRTHWCPVPPSPFSGQRPTGLRPSACPPLQRSCLEVSMGIMEIVASPLNPRPGRSTRFVPLL